MSDIKNQVQSIDPNAKARDLMALIAETNNIYEALSIISVSYTHLTLPTTPYV